MWDTQFNQFSVTNDLTHFLIHWDADSINATRISQGINLVYRFTRKESAYFLRIAHQDFRSKPSIQAAINYQKQLALKKASICLPVPSQQGNDIESSGPFLAHVCQGVPGHAIRLPNTAECLFEWGKQLATLHLATSDWNPSDTYGTWEDEQDEFDAYINKEPSPLQMLYHSVQETLSAYPQRKETAGLIHGDHRKSNVFTDNKAVCFIDFDLPRYSWWMEDITRPFFNQLVYRDWTALKGLQHYLAGYCSVSPLNKEDIVYFADFFFYKVFNIYLWTKYNWEGDIIPGGHIKKDWLQRLLHVLEEHTDWKKTIEKLSSHPL